MSLESWKQAYLKLSPADRKSLAKWIVEQELDGVSPALDVGKRGLKIPQAVGIALGSLIVVFLLLIGGWFAWTQHQNAQAEAARKTQAEIEAAEARRPRSPTNLDFLRQNLGREITVSGVPQAYDVGFLFFSTDPNRSLRLNLVPAGVVVLQSSELSELVANKVELTVTGIVEQAQDGALEIKVYSAGQLKQRKSP
ncbi:MAG: hypothetical protein OHK005_03830 [Candidatus Methylacidiphilales bacterium]